MNLHDKIKTACKLLKNTENIDEKIILTNYLNTLISSIEHLTEDKDKNYQQYEVTINNEKILEKMFEYNYEMIENFIKSKEFHRNYFDQILMITENEYSKIQQQTIKKDPRVTKKEFYYILRDFMKSIKKEELLNQIIEDNKIHKVNNNNREYAYKSDSGYIIYNYLNKDFDIFIKEFSYDIHSLLTLVHEMGHVYDFETLNCDSATYNKYFFQSYYGEVYSKMFERLFISYLIHNNIKKDFAKSLLIDFENNSFASISFSYILSCLEDELLCDQQYDRNKKKKIANKLSTQFTNKNVVKKFIKNYHFMMIPENYNYAYGNIISLFLKDAYEKEGKASTLLKVFSKKRLDKFKEEDFNNWEITPEKYLKLYKKEINSLKN